MYALRLWFRHCVQPEWTRRECCTSNEVADSITGEPSPGGDPRRADRSVRATRGGSPRSDILRVTLRDKNLIPLSHQHQRALALCVRLNRALEGDEVDADAWQAEIAQLFEQEVRFHFAAEEKEVFPRAAQLRSCAIWCRSCWPSMRRCAVCLRRRRSAVSICWDWRSLRGKLSGHIRKEERQLFEEMQKRMSAEEMERWAPRWSWHWRRR